MKMLLLVLLLCAGLNRSFAQAAHENSQSEQQILSLLRSQVEGWNRGSIESFMQGYAKLDTLRFASGGTVSYGWNTMLERYKKSYTTKEKMGTLSFTNVTVDMISEQAAIVFGTWSLKREKDAPWGLFTLLFKKLNGEWRIVHDHTSSGN